MQTATQEAIDSIQLLPDSANTAEITYRLSVLESICRGQQDASHDKLYSAQEVLNLKSSVAPTKLAKPAFVTA